MKIETYKTYPVNIKEALRYSGCPEPLEDIGALMRECIAESEKSCDMRVCYDIFDIEYEGDFIKFGQIKTNSKTVKTALSDCDKVVVFGATAGMIYDRCVVKYERISTSKALLFQGLGAERVESACNAFCFDISKTYKTKPRVSPGYGDIPLQIQTDIFKMLDLERKLGITLTKELLMTPTKSVTALFGIRKKDEIN